QVGDWVYREIEHAFACGKTIVPITTPDFWSSQEKPSLDGKNAVSQEKAEEIARTLDKLSRLQAIEAGPKHFDAAMDDLQGTFPLSRPRKLMVALSRKLVAFALLAVLAAGTLAVTAYCKYRAEQKVAEAEQKAAEKKAAQEAAEFAAAAKEVAQSMGFELATMESHLSTVAGNVDDAWALFASKCRANPAGVDLHDDELLEEIERSREYFDKHVLKDVAPPSSETLEVLRKNGVDTVDINVFYDKCLPYARQGLADYLDGVETYAKEVKELLLLASEEADELELTKEELDEWHSFHSNIDAYDTFARETFRAQELQLQIYYIGYLDVLTTTPKSVYSVARPLFEKTALFAGIPMEQSREDLTTARKNCEEQLRRIISRLDRALLEERLNVEKGKKDNLETLKNKNELSDKREKKENDVEALENELNEKTEEIRSIYDESAAKFALVEGDSFGVCWGKILRLASFLRMNMVVEITPSQKILSDITARIDQCVELCAEEASNLNAFATAAKRYFTLLAEGKIEDAGLIVAFIENDAEHPNLRPGDIIWKVDGNLVHNFNEYEKNFADGKFGHKIERLRFDADGAPTFETYETVEGSPRIALMPFTEEE
ncbi:MAG: hypothetical protein IJE97_12180, partial [Thermoguttaceae bacterium]|nr:hypothetical protein [Thermoguttaceae bacterium]